MIQLVEVLASKSDGRSPVSGTHSEGESQFYKLSSGLHLHTKIHVCAHTSNRATAKTTAKSLAIRTLGSPLAGALHILLVFLISKLLF